MAVVDCKAPYLELRKVLAPVYVGLAFALPPGSGSIWSIVVDDIDGKASSDADLSPGKLLAFLANFFSEQRIQLVASNLDALKESHLGIEYTLGRGEAAIAESIVESVREEAADFNTPLAGFLGQVSEIEDEVTDANDEGWHTVNRKGKIDRSDRSNGGNEFGAGPSQTGSKGAGAGHGGIGAGQGGAGPGNQLVGVPKHFRSMQDNIVLLHLPRYPGSGLSPPRGYDRNITIKERSRMFEEAAAQEVHLSLYDPHSEKRAMVSLFHGTRTSSLRSFCLMGIEPEGLRGEFCRGPAFYTSNSVRHSFERPLHYKIGRGAEDVISVFEFRVDTRILHGDRAPPGETEPFKVRWFAAPSLEWKQFCIGNMAADPELKALTPRHSYDLVIGPVCQPREGGKDMSVVSDRLEGDVFLSQVAFCTPRAWSWLETCFKRVLQERRGPA